MPKLREENLENSAITFTLLSADAAFVAYPQPVKPGCKEVYEERIDFVNWEYCLDADPNDEFLEQVAPLKIRGEGDTVYTVIGSRVPVERMEVWFTGGATGGVRMGGTVGEKRILISSFAGNTFVSSAHGIAPIDGDSGSPIYTKPDASGNVHDDDGEAATLFSSWPDVEEALDLKPISAPDSPSPAEEDEEELADLFSAFD